MKTFPAYNIDPTKLLDALKKAGQPVVEIRYRGPERKNVVLACVCAQDGADDATMKSVIAANSGKDPDIDRQDKHIEALGQGIGQRMQSYKG